jgi:hypothetical protein
MRGTGAFRDVRIHPLAGGAVYVYVGEALAEPESLASEEAPAR